MSNILTCKIILWYLYLRNYRGKQSDFDMYFMFLASSWRAAAKSFYMRHRKHVSWSHKQLQLRIMSVLLIKASYDVVQLLVHKCCKFFSCNRLRFIRHLETSVEEECLCLRWILTGSNPFKNALELVYIWIIWLLKKSLFKTETFDIYPGFN